MKSPLVSPRVFRGALRIALFRLLWIGLGLMPSALFAAFGYTDNGAAYVVDTGAGLVFQVRKTDGTITSIVFNGTDYNGPSGKGSHIASGLGTATTVTPESDGSSYVKIALQTDASSGVVANLTHYLIVRNGENTIYMATYATAEPAVGELRWITRLNSALLTNGPGPSDLRGNTGAIESSDVFGLPDGTTRSKYFGDGLTHGKDRAMDLTVCGATGPGIGVWMVFGSRESSSGGPFFRDIQNQCGDDQEIYNYMNSGHNQTEPYRLNVLHGPYALVFTNGPAPSPAMDFSWMGALGLTGWVPASGRGAVSGTASGLPVGFQGVVGFANATAQYWATVGSGGSYACAGMKPGSYTATLYKGELAVATATVDVAAGATATLDLASAEPAPAVIFRIGEWDGTPAGLLNGDKIVQMHPQDARMSSWDPVPFNVGSDAASAFPAIQFRGKNSPTRINFTLAPNQVTDLTLRIGLTCAYNGGRPQVAVNSWTSGAPAASSQPSSRSFTIGTYRGNNALFTYTIPASALVAGANTLTINPISGSTDIGTWLSAGWVYDAVELDGPVAAPAIGYVGASPLVISGTAEPGRQIALTLDGATAAGSTVAAADGAWSVTFTGTLAAGSHQFTAVASDDAGHSSPASSPYVFNTSLTMPVIGSALGDSGAVGSGATTSDRTFVFNGTAGPGDTVAVTRVGTGVIGTAVANAAGQWTLDYTSVALPAGANAFYAVATNGGETSAASAVFTLAIAGAPAVSIVHQDPLAATITPGVGQVVFRVAFRDVVSGVTPAAFVLTTTGDAAGTIAGVSAASGATIDVTVNALAGAGLLRLDLRPASGIVDSQGNPVPGYHAGEPYTLVAPSLGSGTWIRASTGGRWSDPTNWQDAVIADGAANSANFGTLDLTTAATVHLDSPRTLAGVTWGDTDPASAASWIVDNAGDAGNRLTLAGTAPTITVGALGSGATATLQAGLAGSAGLTKAGAGTLVLAAANPLTGALSLTGGGLQLAPGGSLDLGASPVNLALNTRLNVAGGSLATTGLVSAATSAVVIDAGTATLGSFRTNSDFGASLRINGGTLAIGDVNIRRNSAAAADFNSGFIVAGTGVVTATTIEIGSQNSTGAMSVEGGGVLTATGVVTIANQATGGRGGAMRVLNNGTLTSTDTTLGVLLCRNNGANANNVGSATFTGGTSTIEKFTLGYDATVTAGSATITLNGGTLYLGSGGIVKNGAAGLATNLNFSSGTLGAKASWATAVPVNFPSGGNVMIRAADAAGAAFDVTLGGAVGGAGGFTKTGGGRLKLTGAASYGGPTVVNAGTLEIAGTLAAAANGIAVNAGGTLAGGGTIGREVALNSGGTLAAGAPGAVGTLNGSALTWNGGGVWAVDLGASGASDRIVLGGGLTRGADGSFVLALHPTAALAAGDLFTVATFASTTFGPGEIVVTGLPDGYGAQVILTPTELRIVIVARPVITSAATATGMYGAAFSYAITADNGPTTYHAVGLPAGLALDADTGVISGTPAAAGTFTVELGATNAAGTGAATLTLTVNPAPATVVLGGSGGGGGRPVRIAYDGTPKLPTVTTAPAGLPVTFTFDGSSTPPTLPGTYHVVATVTDPNYTGSVEGTLVITVTALVRHAPALNGDLDGSLQLLAAESFAVNGGASVAGDLLVPGSPTVRLNGQPLYGGTQEAAGAAAPGNYTVTLNGNAVVRHVVRRVDPIAMPVVTAPAAPAGSRDVNVNRPGEGVGDFATIRNLTLNGKAGALAVPAGVYGSFTANGGGGFMLGVAGATEPAVYQLQRLTLNGNAALQVVGPVVLKLANGVTLTGAVGASGHPEWLEIEVFSGGLTINGQSSLHGVVTAPNGTVIVNGGSTLVGRVSADRLTLNGASSLAEPAP